MEDLQFRQGDVYLFQVDKLPDADKCKPVGKNHVLAYGEATGHCHAIKKDDCELFEANDNIRALAKKNTVSAMIVL